MVTRIHSDPRAREKPCLRCCTSLRAHLDDRYCPQCGLSVWLSLNANDALDTSRPAWLRATSRACYLLAAVQVVGFFAWALTLLHSGASAVFSFMDQITAEDLQDSTVLPLSTTQPTTQQIQEATQQAIAQIHAFNPTPKLAALALAAAGIYFLLNAAALLTLTIQEQRYPDKQKSTRLATRIVAGLTAAFSLLMLASAFASLRPGAESHVNALTRDLTTTGLLYLAEFSFIATSICLWLYLRPIATRGRRHGLRKITSWLLFLPLLGLAKIAPFAGFYFLSFLLPIVLVAAHFLPAVYIPVSIVLLFQFARMLQKAVPHAEQSWAAETKPA